MSELSMVLAALKADGEEIDGLIAGLSPDQWQTSTPAPGWTIAHQVAHLSATFRMAGLAASDPAKFKAVASQANVDFEAAVEATLAPYLALEPHDLFTKWRTERASAVDALAAVPDGELVPWLVNPLPPTVLASAGMMEMFGHGQDIADALGAHIERTDRIKPIVAFAVHTRHFGYLARNQEPPAEEFRFEITSPSGAQWTFGPDDATQRIHGPAVDFCLLASRRRHHTDLALVAEGAHAQQWLEIAQAYRGPAGEGRKPGQFAAVSR